ncbi:hypothetical protein FOA52_005382 [Chlamydomonas sp. UWO 241]|nr:hypothetical protein FOA52_005382 [Chlamydomonas sp. UWO 241]
MRRWTLSNAVEFTGLLAPYRRTASCSMSSFFARVFGQQQKKLPEAAVGVTLGRAPLGATDRPALAPMLELYLHLYNSGYSVAFITGRSEDFRAGTEDNLAAAGYGRQCDMLPEDDVREGEPNHVRTVDPCYVQLLLRTVDDKRPASAYKPDQRKALESAAYTVFGNFGDQFSDLDGLHVTPHSFKLPNPGYLIL